MSKTDPQGIIKYCNDYFIKINGYEKDELIGSPHNIIRHPDMPKVIFKLLWDRLRKRKKLYTLVKNLTKNGNYYWVMTQFDTKTKNKTKEPIEYIAYRKAAPKQAIIQIEQLYKKLVEIEKERGIKGSEKYLRGFLEEREQTYDEFIDEITLKNKHIKFWFKSMKKFFSSINYDKISQDRLG
jgi:PAS domain S-box-containing protein